MNTTILTSGADTNAGGASTFDTASVTLTAGRHYAIGVITTDAASEQDPTSVAQVGGESFTKQSPTQGYSSSAAPTQKLSIWTLLCTGTVAGVIRLTANDATTGFAWIVCESDTPHATTPVPQVVVVNVTDGATSLAATLGALGSANNHQIGFHGCVSANTQTVSGTNWSSMAAPVTFTGPTCGLQAALNTAGSATQLTFSSAQSIARGLVVIEIAAAAAAGTSPPPRRPSTPTHFLKRRRYY